MERHAQRRSARRGGFTGPVQHLSAQAGQVRRDRFSSRNTPEGTSGGPTPQYAQVRPDDGARAGAATGPQPGNCAGGCAACPAGTPRIPATGGCVTAGTPMITSWGSSDRRPKPRRSRHAAGGVPARRTQAGTDRGQDPDHARPHRRGAIPRLRDHRPAQRHKITAAAHGQRDDRVARATGR